jgi:hypothetical protein
VKTNEPVLNYRKGPHVGTTKLLDSTRGELGAVETEENNLSLRINPRQKHDGPASNVVGWTG